MPARFARINPRFKSPGFATLAMGCVSVLWYVGLTMLSQDVLSDSILALGLGIAFYYALTGFACVIYFRRKLLASAGSFFFLGLLPGLGGLMMVLLFVKSCFDLIGDPLFIGLGALLAGVVLMIACQFAQPAFFRRKPEVATS